jgi:branched-chain amino acid transport system substrate-binding protein
MKKNIALSLITLVLVILFSLTCFAAEKILFAVVGPMTGDSAAFGIQMQNGAKIAVDEINKSGGINGKEFEFIVGDDMATPAQAVIVAQKFSINKNILFILGHNNSGCTIAAQPIWEKAGLPVISPSNSANIVTRSGYKNYFRVEAKDEVQVSQIAKVAVVELGFKNIGIVYENSDYGRSALDIAVKVIPELGAKILGTESFVPAIDRDYSSIITKFKGLGVDCVLFIGEYTANALFLKQSVNLGFNAQQVAPNGSFDPKLIEIAGKAAEGFYCGASFNPNDPRPKQAKFIENFEAFYKDKPGEWGAHAYDIVYMVEKAIEMGGTTREKLIEVLHSPDFEYDGVTGLIKFDQYGDVPNLVNLTLKVKDGEFTAFFPTKY